MAWNLSNVTKPPSVSSLKVEGYAALDRTATASSDLYFALAEKPSLIMVCRETTQHPSGLNAGVGCGGSDMMNLYFSLTRATPPSSAHSCRGASTISLPS